MGELPTPHNLPAETATFIGRNAELDDIRLQLHRTRLLTLTGPGGCGKTRLALRLAHDLVPVHAGGVWFVSLAPISDDALLPHAVASALGIQTSSDRPPVDTLASAIATRRMLLILDNCEHLIAACALFVHALLERCPQLRVLATSREPLRLPGETVWRVPPLGLPPPEHETARGDLPRGEAVTLFLERARAHRPQLTLVPENAQLIGDICRRLDGLPLAIELAAAQLGALTLDELARRLGDAMQLLEGGNRVVPRQETLRATLDWSHALLGEHEALLFRRLGVFVSGFELEAAESICSDAELDRAQIFAALMSLTRKSLVEAGAAAGVTRFRLLEPIRQYALQRLEIAQELDRLRSRHLAYLADLASALDPVVTSSARAPAMARLAAELHDIRAAVQWSVHSPDRADLLHGLQLMGSCSFFWHMHGAARDGYELVETVLGASGDVPAPLRGRALYASAELAWLTGHTSVARQRAEEAVAVLRDAGDHRYLGFALQSLPLSVDNPDARTSVAESERIFRALGDRWGVAMARLAVDLFALMRNEASIAEGRERLQQALSLWHELGDDWGIAQACNMLGDLERSAGNHDAAAEHYERALACLQRTGATGTIPSVQQNLGYLALSKGETRRAMRLFQVSLDAFARQGDGRGVADGLTGLACALAEWGRSLDAARLLGRARAIREEIGAAIWPVNAEHYERCVATLRAALGEADLATAMEAGGASSTDAVLGAALPDGPPAGESAESPLSPRELEVAALVARGMTNRQIGTELFITEGTAGLHVKHILQKLDFTSRAQIAAWVAQR